MALQCKLTSLSTLNKTHSYAYGSDLHYTADLSTSDTLELQLSGQLHAHGNIRC